MPVVKKVRHKKSPLNKKKKFASSKELVLPTEDNVPPSDLSQAVFLIYGRKAIGKTTLANKFDAPLTFMFERARRNLAIRQVPSYEPTDKKRKSLNWEQFIEYVELFVASDEYQTAVIDTIDRCYIECFDYICHNAGIKDPGESSRSYEIWQAIDAEFNSVIGLLQESGKGLILLSHEKVELINNKVKSLRRDGAEDEQKMGRWEPSCKPAGRRVIQEICDYVFYYCFVENKRAMYVRSPTEIAWCACGFDGHFLDPNGEQIDKFELGDTPDQAYQSLIAAYDNELYDIDYEPPKVSKKKKRLSK